MKIIGIILVYNCGDIVLEALKSLDGRVDEIYCYDSCWMPKFWNVPYSNDDTQSVIENFDKIAKSKVEYHKLTSPTSERRAREESIANIAEGDWVFMLDADETITMWNPYVRSILEQSNEAGYLFYWANGSVFPVCRLFRKQNGTKYYNNNPCSPSGKKLSEDLKLNVINITVYHDIRKRRCPNASGYAQRPHP